MLEGIYFVYDGIDSRDMSIMNVTVDGGMFNEPFLAGRQINEVIIRGRDEPYFQGVTRSPLTLTLSFAFEATWDENKIREVARWLNQEYYKPFYTSDNPNRIFYCMSVNDSRLIHNGLKEGYITLEMRCNSPYSYSQEYLSQTNDVSLVTKKLDTKTEFEGGTLINTEASATGDLQLSTKSQPAFSRSSDAYMLDGVTKVTPENPRYETGKFGNGVLIEEGTTQLILNSDMEVLNPVKQTVLFDDFNRAGTATFTGSYKSIFDFLGKTAGQISDVPHVAKFTVGGVVSFGAPTSFTSEFNTSGYTQVSTQDGTNFSQSTSTNTMYGHTLFSFDLLNAFKLAGYIPQSWDVATLKVNITSLNCTWVGYGVGSNAGVSTNAAQVKVWNKNTLTWNLLADVLTSSPSPTVKPITIANYVDDNGFLNILANSTYPSNGTIASTIYTDYVKVDATVNTLARHVSGRFQNVFTKNQSDIETDLTGIGANNSAVLSIDATTSWQGVSSIRIVCDGTLGYQGANMNISNAKSNKKYIFSAYAKSESATGNIYITCNGVAGPGTMSTAQAINNSGWTRISYTITATATGGTLNFVIHSPSVPTAMNFWLDGVQLEEAITSQTNPTDWRVGGSGMGILIEEGTTNLFTANQSNIEIDLTGFNTIGSGITLSRDITTFWMGTSSLKVVTPGTSANEGFYTSSVGASASIAYTSSVRLKGSGNIRVYMAFHDAQNAVLGYSTLIPVTATANWVNYVVTATSPVNTTSIRMVVETQTTTQAITFWVDGLQIEQKTYATSWVIGGTTRNAEKLTIPTTGMSATTGTWEQWVYVTANTRLQTGFPYIFNIPRSNGIDGITVYHAVGGAVWALKNSADDGTYHYNSTPDSDTPDGWHLFSVTWTNTSLKLYIDGSMKLDMPNPKLPTAFAASATVGGGSGSGTHEAIRISNVERTQVEITAYYNATSPFIDNKTVILLDFNGDLDAETLLGAGWTQSVATDVVVKGNKANIKAYKASDLNITHGDLEWTDVIISTKMARNSGTTSNFGITFRTDSSGNRWGILSTTTGWILSQWLTVGGYSALQTSATAPLVAGIETTVVVTITGSTVSLTVGGIAVFTNVNVSVMSTSGYVGMFYNNTNRGGLSGTFDDFEVKADVPDVWIALDTGYSGGSKNVDKVGYTALTTGYNSTYAIKRTAVGITQNSDGSFLLSNYITGSANTTYTISFWHKGSYAIPKMHFLMQCLDASGVHIAYVGDTYIATTGTWQKATITFTTPANTARLIPRWLVSNYSPGWYAIDAVQLEQKNYATTYMRNNSLTNAFIRAPEVLTIPITNVLNSNSGTISFWFKPNEIHNWNDIIGGVYDASTRWLVYTDSSGAVYWDWGATNTNIISTSNTLTAGIFYHMIFKWNNGIRDLYINGVKKVSGTYDKLLGFPNTFGFGVATYSDVNGTIDDLRISSIARTDAEILDLYNSNAPAPVDIYTTYKLDINSNLQAKSMGQAIYEFNISTVGKINSSSITYNKNMPANTTLTVEARTSLTGTWSNWQIIDSGNVFPGITNNTDVTNAKLQYKITLSTTDIPLNPKLNDIAFNISYAVIFTNYGDTNCKPEIWITKIGSGNVTIINTTNGNSKFEFLNLIDGETVYVDNQNGYIDSDLNGNPTPVYRYGNFNDNYMELVRGINRLTVTGACKIVFRTKFKSLQG